MHDRIADLTDDQLFGLYCTSGRPRYLAAVFDRTAAELLRVATHLSRDAAEAEDLVQGTYVEAIRLARRYRPGRRVVPWLVGILGNLAREARRKERRRFDSDRLARPPDGDPVDHASSVELARAVDDAIEKLPEAYRQVLLLHLRHGLAPGEIASLVRRSPGTVRSTLSRGLAKLQRVLPAGFASAVAITLLPGRGLAAVRRAVVWRARWAGPGLLLASSATWLRPVAGATAAVLLMAAALTARVLVRTEEPDGAVVTPVAVVGTPRDRGASAAATGAVGAGRTAVDDRSGAAAAAPARVVVQVRRRGVAELAGIGVRLRPLAGSDPLLEELCRRTDAFGNAVFESVPAGPAAVELDRAVGPDVELEPGGSAQVDVDLDAGIDVCGSVVDTDGRPVPRASIWIAERGLADCGVVATETDAEGRFELLGVAATHQLAAFAPGYEVCRPMPPRERVELTLVTGAGAVTGRVTDAAGRPIEGALVRAGAAGPPFYLLDPDGGPQHMVTNRPPLTARTDRDGWYRLPSVSPGKVEVFARASGRVGDRRKLTVGTGQVARHDVVLHEGSEVYGRVLDGDAAAPGLLVMRGPIDVFLPGWFAPRARTDAAGRYRLRGVAAGEGETRVFAGEGGTVTRRLPVRAGQRVRWDVALHGVPGVGGCVVDGTGAPRSGVEVQLFGERVFTRTTGADGRFRFAVGDDRPYELLVYDPASPVPTAVATRRDLRPGDDVVVVVDDALRPSGFLCGRVLSPEGEPAAGAVARLRRAGHGTWVDVAVDHDTGRFLVGPLVPGTFEVRLLAPGHPVTDPGERTVAAGSTADLGTVRLARGGRIGLRVTVGGRAVHESVQLSVHGPRGRLLQRRDLVEPDHVTEWLPLGPCRVTVRGHGVPIARADVEVRPGCTVPAEIEVGGAERVRVTLGRVGAEVAGADGSVLAHLSWSDELGREIATDDYCFTEVGVLGFTQSLLPGRYGLRVTTATGYSGDARLEVESGAPAPVRVVLRH